MMRVYIIFLFIIVFSLSGFCRVTDSRVADYNVRWTKQSLNSSESMPCGGGDIGLNVWVEKNELLVYLSRSGAFDENNLFPKFGRLRIKLSPNPFQNATFLQNLNLRDGYIEIETLKEGKKTQLEIWVDVYNPIVHIEVVSDEKVTMEAVYENWRTQTYSWKPDELMGNIAFRGAPSLPVVHPDSISPMKTGIMWYHRNRKETFFDATVKMQGLEPVKEKLWNPLSVLTFGGYMGGKGLSFSGVTTGRYLDTDYKGWILKSDKAQRNHSLWTVLHINQTDTYERWLAGLEELKKMASTPQQNNKTKTRKWWNDFWARSYVFIDKDKGENAVSYQIGRNYQLFRYQLGCNAYGKYPTKFNGGLFTYDPSLTNSGYRFNPDYRNWGGGTFTAQNQRLVYWPMLRNGDFDMMPSQFDFYLRTLGNAEIRTEFYWKHRGASFTEQIECFGLPIAYCYGWNRKSDLLPGYQQNQWVEHQWDTSLEFCMMILETNRYDGVDISKYIPLIESCLYFFDEHYQKEALKRGTHALDANGHLILYPGTGAETYKLAYNSVSTISALKCVLQGLLNLDDKYLQREKKIYFEEMMRRIPPISFREMKGHKTIAPAVTFSRIQNGEIPQLYPVYPWGIYGIGRPDLQVAVDTWKYGVENADQKSYLSWHQDAIFCARLGLTQEAKELTIKKMGDSERRFPTFWGPGHDWTPDHNWGGSGMIGVQEMLMQTVDDKIYILPAWPKEWNVEFKLHAPYNTTVECVYCDGKISRLVVVPKEREKDIIVLITEKAT